MDNLLTMATDATDSTLSQMLYAFSLITVLKLIIIFCEHADNKTKLHSVQGSKLRARRRLPDPTPSLWQKLFI